MTTLFLGDADLVELTGYRQPTRQVAQLRRMGIPFFTNAAGHPKVARAAIEGGKEIPLDNSKPWEPEWGVSRP